MFPSPPGASLFLITSDEIVECIEYIVSIPFRSLFIPNDNSDIGK